MGSNPTPRASNGGSNSSNINNLCKDPIVNQDKKMTLQQQLISDICFVMSLLIFLSDAVVLINSLYTTCSKVFVKPSFCISFSVSTNSRKNLYNDTKQHEMNQQEIKEIIDDIISEVKESK